MFSYGFRIAQEFLILWAIPNANLLVLTAEPRHTNMHQAWPSKPGRKTWSGKLSALLVSTFLATHAGQAFLSSLGNGWRICIRVCNVWWIELMYIVCIDIWKIAYHLQNQLKWNKKAIWLFLQHTEPLLGQLLTRSKRILTHFTTFDQRSWKPAFQYLFVKSREILIKRNIHTCS